MTTDGLFTTLDSTRYSVGQGPYLQGQAASATIDFIVDRLQRRLRELVDNYGLARREVLRVQQGIVRLDRVGLAPTGNDFWASTARPRAQLLIDRAREAIDHELSLLIAEISFGDSFEPGDDSFVADFDEVTRPGLPIRSSCRGESPRDSDACDLDLLGRVLPLLPRSHDLDDLGRWWQRRLRRAAIVHALPKLMMGTTMEASLIVSRTEMELLDRAPWVHGDRLLSAFELAYAEIERVGTARIHQAQSNLEWAHGGRLALRL